MRYPNSLLNDYRATDCSTAIICKAAKRSRMRRPPGRRSERTCRPTPQMTLFNSLLNGISRWLGIAEALIIELAHVLYLVEHLGDLALGRVLLLRQIPDRMVAIRVIDRRI